MCFGPVIFSLTLMPLYRWRCLACEIANAPTSERCTNCGCLARPTYAQIRNSKTAAGIVDPVDGPTLVEVAGALKAYLTGKPGDRGFIATVFFELFIYVIGVLFLLLTFALCKLLGIL